AVLGPDLAGTTKPEPTMLRMCREAMGLDRTETLYVGDMAPDVESARQAGVPVVLVPGGSSSLDALRATGVPVLADLTDLLSLLPPRAPAATGLTGPPGRGEKQPRAARSRPQGGAMQASVRTLSLVAVGAAALAL